jgi:hypothetical protein
LAAIILCWIAAYLREPRYLGRTAGEWFPRWQTANGRGTSTWVLTNEPPEFFPVLVKASRMSDGPTAAVWKIAMETFPDEWLTRFPQPVPAEQVRMQSISLMARGCQRPDFAERVSRGFDELDTDAQKELLHNLGRFRAGVKNTLPLVERQLGSQDPDLRLLAVWALSSSPDLARPHAARLVETLVEIDGKTNALGLRYSMVLGLLFRTAEWSPLDPSVIHGIAHFVNHPQPRIRVDSRLALARLDPLAYPIERYFAQELPRAKPADMEAVSGFFRMAFGRRRPMPEIGPWLALALKAEWDPSVARPPVRDPLGNLKMEILRIVSQYPTVATGAVDAILPLLDSPDAGLRRVSGEALERIGPQAPDSVPRLAAALQAGRMPVSMLRLLVAYGRLPTDVEPLVRRLAAGTSPEGWTADGEVGISRNRGLQSLQELAQTLLARARTNEPAGNGLIQH